MPRVKIFEIYWSWYEDNIRHILVGPDISQDEFDKLCKDLLHKVASSIIEEKDDTWVGYNDLMCGLKKELRKNGFYEPETISYGCWGGYILRNEKEASDKIPQEVNDVIIKHNNKIYEEEYYDE